MLFGEYAVLEGRRALAMCVDRRIACTLRESAPTDRVRLVSPGVFEPPIELPLWRLDDPEPPDELELLWPLIRPRLRGGHELTFEADFPPTWGLGSSSAALLAAGGALGVAPDELLVAARDAQRSLQGRASGYDVATQLTGGFVAYRDGDPPRVDGVEPGPGLCWLVAWTGRKAKTSGMIRKVMARGSAGALLDRIGALTEAGLDALVAGDGSRLGPLLNDGQALLDALGATPLDLADQIAALQADPAVLGARLSGAGGGDCLLILAADVAAAAAAATNQGFEVLDLNVESDGLIIEESNP
jgi:mevalonate kinase